MEPSGTTGIASKSSRPRPPQQQHHHHHHHHRSPRREKEDGRSPGDKSGSENTSKSKHSASKHIRECACGRGLACVGMTQAFRLLGDPRCYYVELPRYRKNPPAYKYVFRNNLRAAYIRHLKSQNPSLDVEALENMQDRRYVALHHFHPAVVKAFYENPLTSGAAQKHRVPISITEHELQELNLDIRHEDRILSVTGAPTGGYYFCPGYAQEKAHEDLKQLIKKARSKKEKMESQKAGMGTPSSKKVVPENIEVAKHKNSTSRSPVQDPRRSRPSSDQKLNDVKPEIKSPSPPSSESTKTPPPLSSFQPLDPVRDEDYPQKEDKNELTAIPSHVFPPSSPEQLLTVTSTITPPLVEEISMPHDPVVNLKDAAVGDTTGQDLEIPADENHLQHEDLDELVHTSDIAYLSDHLYYDENGNVVCDDEPRKSKSNETPDLEPADIPCVSNRRASEHPWATPKNRRRSALDEPITRTSTTPAQFIDPNITTLSMEEEADQQQDPDESYDTNQEQTDTGLRSSLRQDDDASDIAAAAAAAQKSAAAISAAALMAMKSIDEVDETNFEYNASSRQVDPPGWAMVTQDPVPTSPAIQQMVAESKSFESQVSEESSGTGAIKLHHSYPGVDPTLRIQVHNDLIAWESKRRSEMSNLLNWHGEKWNALRCLLTDGLEEIKVAERFIQGFSKAGSLFADLTQAVYEDKLLDDAGKTVSNSFLQNRLHKKRNAQEYSIETQDSLSDSGQSPLLSSILEAQIQLANNFRETSQHIDDEIIPELYQLHQEMQAQARECEALGDSIIAELKRSEIELKNIWDVFDAMVTGDLMEYTVHGSMHGGSQHGGSIHSSLTPGTGSSMHGLLSTREGEGLIVSSVNSPIVKSTFKQLGSVEDGWLVEMYYRSAVAYQQAVYGVAANEFGNLGKRITTLEEQRFRKLQELMLAFVPRQRRLLIALPENFKTVLDDLVGLRIDEESLQAIIDNSIRDRSRDHLKRGASHRSAIMNRSKISKTDDGELERIEVAFGNPFESSWVLSSKVVELQSGGIMGMVNTSWKAALVVVTSEGNLHVFSLPEGSSTIDQSPQQAFSALCPTTEFDPTNDWPRKEEITKNMVPTLTISLKHSTFVIPKAQNCHLQVTEDKPLTVNSDGSGGGRNGFMKVMKAAADSQRTKKCTFRLSSPIQMHDWHYLLEQTKKSMTAHSKNDTKRASRFGF